MKSRLIFGSVVPAIICSVLLFSSGCQSGAFKKPDLGKLAFWKNDNLQLASRTEEIPPPSSHFDPEGQDDDATTKKRIEARLAKMAEESKKNQGKPSPLIRKPYSLDSIDSKIRAENKTSDASNDFVLDKKLNKLQSATGNALKTTENTVKQTGESVENTANALAGLKNNLQTGGEQTINSVSNKLKHQAGNVVAGTTSAVNSLANTTENTINQTVSTVKNSIDNSFQPVGGNSGLVANPYASQSNANQPKATQTASDAGMLKSQTDSEVQQSSFDASISRRSSGILQPVAGTTESAVNESEGTTVPAYPTTPYGLIRAANRIGDGESQQLAEIPSHLLRGTSNFAPGSTTPLQPADSAK